MKSTLKILFVLTIAMALAAPSAMAVNAKPGEGVTVKPARATWNTGFFQEALVRRGLEEMGYDVKTPKDLQNPIFYKSVALGDVDYWTNGWLPNHESQFPKNFYDDAGIYGYVVKAGGLQGYLVSKREVEQYNIQSLDDFKRPEVKKAFDKNGDGKADLTACPPGWGLRERHRPPHGGLRPGRPHQSRQGVLRGRHGLGPGGLQERRADFLLHLRPTGRSSSSSRART